MASQDPRISILSANFAYASPPAEMTSELRAQIAERLLMGEKPEQVVRWLEIRRIAPQTARSEVANAEQDPFYAGSRRLAERLKKRDWQLSIHRRLAELDPDAGSVPVETAISGEDFLRRYYVPNRPVLLRTMIDHWPAMDKWGLDYFDSLFGETPVSVQWGRESSPDYERDKQRHRRSMPFAELSAKLRTDEPSNDYYVTAGNEDNERELAALRDDIGDLPGILDFSGGNRGFFWMGPQGTITPFHHDLTNNLLVQISGRKRVKLAASHDAALMRNDAHCFSRWNGEDLPEAPPGEGKPRVIEVTLNAGEALFLPVGWWHHVEALDMTIGMSFTNFVWPNDHYSDYTSYGQH